ncbi:MAG: YSC84-related protein [Pseudomonadota bacterium]
MVRLWRAMALLVGVASVCGCAAAGSTVAEQRAATVSMRTEVLTELYAQKASARSEIAAAPGYAVFSNANINVVLASVGGGYGIVRDNGSGVDTYMRMGEVGVGLGAGVKDTRLVFVFHDRDALTDFVENGWSVGANADAAAKASDKGGAVGAEALVDRVTIYQLTKSGLALQATVKGTRYWRDDRLN